MPSAEYRTRPLVLPELLAQRERLQERLQRLSVSGAEADIARVEKMLTQNMLAIGMATGEISKMDESRLAQSPRFQRFCVAICKSLTPFPDALAAVLSVMRAEDTSEGAR